MTDSAHLSEGSENCVACVTSVFEAMRDAICVCVEGQITQINAAGVHLLGLASAKEAMGRELQEFIPPDYREAASEMLSLKVFEIEPVPLRLVRKDKKILEIEISVHLIVELGERTILAVMRDITQEGKLAREVRLGQMRFRQLVDNAMHLMCVCTDSRIDYINHAGLALLGAKDASQVVGRSLFDFFAEEYREIFEGEVAALIAEPGVVPVRLARLDGVLLDAQIGTSILPSKNRGHVEFMLEARDITAHNRAVGALRKLNETLEQRVIERTRELATTTTFLNTLIEAIPNPIWHKDVEGRFLGYNRAFRDLRHIPGNGWIGRTVAELYTDKKAVEIASKSDHEAITAKGSVVYEYSMPQPDGGHQDLIVSKTAFADADGHIAGTIGVMTDVTEMKRLENELRRLATTDSLTGAFNRRHFMESANSEIARSRRHQHALSVLMFDIDKFKSINDNYGHPVGDEAIRALARNLTEGGRNCDLVGRLGGEEFAMLLPETPLEQAIEVAERLRLAIMDIRIQAGDKIVSYTSSIGVAELAERDRNIEDMLSRADEALYEAKNSGRNRVVSRT
jgi:diguanylate cyclase (GGDEF)-like protein/PAS domain S-box-containing protein